MIARWLAVALAMLGLLGCESPTPQTPQQAQSSLARNYRLPPGAENIREMGDYWVSFEITTEGHTRRFLHTYFPGSHMSTIEVTPR